MRGSRSRRHHGRRKRGARHAGGARVRVRSHTRTPRGPNQGKKPVRVKGYTRHAPRPS